MAEFATSANRNVGQNNPEIGRKERLSLWIRPGKRQINPEKGSLRCGFDPEKGRVAFTQAAPEANLQELKTMLIKTIKKTVTAMSRPASGQAAIAAGNY